MQGIEVFGDVGNFQFGNKLRGMKVLKRIALNPPNIITGDTGNSTQPNFYVANHWWSTENIFSPHAIIAVRPLTKGAPFYAHYYRGSRAWFNTPARPPNATFTIFVSRPCDVYIYDYPQPAPAHMAGLVAWDEFGRETFSSDGIHMRLAAFHTGTLPVMAPADPYHPFPQYGDSTLPLPNGQYMVCPAGKPYQSYLSDEYPVGSSTVYDFQEYNPWYEVGDNYVKLLFRVGFLTGMSGLALPDVSFPQFSTLVLHADWEQNLPVS